jgi:Platelet-activating factor acetylhydrolase, isoform II
MRMTTFRAGCAVLCAALAPLAHAFNHTDTVSPLAPGPFTVACSNIEQNASLIASGASASDYWEGRNGHYVTDLMVHPEPVTDFQVAVPDNRSLYLNHHASNVQFAAIICYPTSASNSDANYTLPGSGDVIPHMQVAGQAPKFISVAEYNKTLGIADPFPEGIPTPMPLPTIVFSHGLTGSPISSGYVSVLVEMAAHGFVVGGVFHGDPRFSLVRIEDLSDAIYLLQHFGEVVELELLRPLSLKVMLDNLLADPDFSRGMDANRIGGFGASMGGAAMTFLAGSWATTTVGGHCDEPVHDPRIRAFAGYVPWGGYSFLNGYCNNQSGAAFVNKPYLALSGTADTTAPLTQMKQAVNNFTNTRYMVELTDGQHELRPQDAPMLFTWLITYFDTYLDVTSDPGAFGRLVKMNNVSGTGRVTNMTVDVHIPFPNAGSELTVQELYNPVINHYYYTDNAFEANQLTTSPYMSWKATGNGFKAWPAPPTVATLPVCRFDLAGHGPGAGFAFFSASASDCSMLMGNRGWNYFGTVFYVQPVDANLQCPAGYIGVNRAYNNGAAHFDTNHRYNTSDSIMRDMARQGWSYEATVMCSRP